MRKEVVVAMVVGGVLVAAVAWMLINREPSVPAQQPVPRQPAVPQQPPSQPKPTELPPLDVAESLLACRQSESEAASEKCAGLDERACVEHPSCRGRYGPSSCQDGACTKDMVFKGCASVPTGELQQQARMRCLCERSGGQLVEAQHGGDPNPTCRCPSLDPLTQLQELRRVGRSYFMDYAGCTTMKAICEASGGEWKQEPTPRINKQHTSTNPKPSDCGSSVNATGRWDEDEQTCVFVTDGYHCFIDNTHVVSLENMAGRYRDRLSKTYGAVQ